MFLGLAAAHVEIVSVEPVGEGGRVLHVVRRVLEKPLELHELISFVGDRLRIETAVTAASPAAVAQVITLGERIDWGNVPTWAEGHGFVTHGGTFAADFLARDSYGAAYAVCSEGGRLLARFDAPEVGFHEGAATGESPESVRPDVPTTRRIIAVTHAAGSLGKAVAALPCGPRPGRQPARAPEGLPGSAHVEVARCAQGGRGLTPFTRFLPDEAEVTLPRGCFQMRSDRAGARFEPRGSRSRRRRGARLPPAGRLRFAVTEKGSGRALPARVLVRGQQGHRAIPTGATIRTPARRSMSSTPRPGRASGRCRRASTGSPSIAASSTPRTRRTWRSSRTAPRA